MLFLGSSPLPSGPTSVSDESSKDMNRWLGITLTFLACRAHYPGGSNRCLSIFFPVRAAFPG
jgi:hypothetical protein